MKKVTFAALAALTITACSSGPKFQDDSFVSNPTPAPSYKLNDRFYSKDWSGYTGTPSQFK